MLDKVLPVLLELLDHFLLPGRSVSQRELSNFEVRCNKHFKWSAGRGWSHEWVPVSRKATAALLILRPYYTAQFSNQISKSKTPPPPNRRETRLLIRGVGVWCLFHPTTEENSFNSSHWNSYLVWSDYEAKMKSLKKKKRRKAGERNGIVARENWWWGFDHVEQQWSCLYSENKRLVFCQSRSHRINTGTIYWILWRLKHRPASLKSDHPKMENGVLVLADGSKVSS